MSIKDRRRTRPAKRHAFAAQGTERNVTCHDPKQDSPEQTQTIPADVAGYPFRLDSVPAARPGHGLRGALPLYSDAGRVQRLPRLQRGDGRGRVARSGDL